MTSIKIDQTHTDDERWIAAGADAFAVHVAALVYCDRQLTEGNISAAMASRVCLPVPASRTKKAVAALVEQGFWRATDGGYRIENYHDHAIAAEQQLATRARWKADKDRKRQHNIGDHSLCKDPKYCPAIRDRSTVEAGVEAEPEAGADATGGGSHLYPTQQDPTRPDPTEGRGGARVGEMDASGSDGSSLRSPAASPPASPPPVWPGAIPVGALRVNGQAINPMEI